MRSPTLKQRVAPSLQLEKSPHSKDAGQTNNNVKNLKKKMVMEKANFFTLNCEGNLPYVFGFVFLMAVGSSNYVFKTKQMSTYRGQ